MHADQILVEGLAFTGRHGWFDHERREGCRFVVDLVLTLDARPAAASDRLADTVDYGAVVERVLSIGQGDSVRLLERLSERIVDGLLDGFPKVARVELTLRKLDAPIAGAPRAVGVRIVRERPHG
ncbi:dihydroneopterin aldolase [Myxococcota bacterium]|jgi:dihydroneopterin aldolase|nr:dihydroneopterin aldolase [Myxococcota bacterium]